MGARRCTVWGTILALAAGCAAPCWPSAALAADLFGCPEDEARDLFARGEFDAAAAIFRDEYRRGVALYRAGRFAEAAQVFERVDREAVRLDALYNLGNARFHLEDYRGAVQAYEEVLRRDPSREDAAHNLNLAMQGLAEAARAGEEPEREAQVRKPREPEPEPSRPQEARSPKERQESRSSESQQQESQQQESQQGSQQQEGQQGSEQQRGSQQQGQAGSQPEAGQEGGARTGGTDEGEDGPEESFPEGEGSAESQGEAGAEPREGEGREGGTQRDEAGQETGQDRPPEAPPEPDPAKVGAQENGEEPSPGAAEREPPQPGPGEKEGEDSTPTRAGEPQPQPRSETGEREGAASGKPPEGLPGKGGEERGDRPRDDGASRAVDRVDQMGGGAPRPDGDAPPGAGFDPALGKTGAGPSVPDWVVQQWLERVDADPGRLLRNQFKVEESRVEERTGGALVEPRPW